LKIVVVLKGNIRKRRQFDQDISLLQPAFPTAEVQVLESTSPGQARELAAAVCGNCDYLIAAGGDGTINEVINGCLQARNKDRSLTLPCFGLLALGTANDMARSLGLKGDVAELCQLLAEKETRPIDAGLVEFENSDGQPTSRYFLNIADFGIGTAVVQQLHRRNALVGSNIHYLIATMIAFLTYQKQDLQVTLDNRPPWRGKTLALIAANGRYFGSGLCVAPGAALDDGQLFITHIGNVSTLDFVRNLRHLKKGIPLNHPEARYDHAQTVEVTSKERPMPVEVDGELIGFTPARISCLPLALRFIAPR
jgi:diacylglycerol kinase (ATP)